MRIRSHAITAAALTTLVATSPAFSADRDFDLAAFSAIEASAGIDVEVKQGDTQSVYVTAKNASDFDKIKLEVRDGTLHVSTEFGLLDFIFNGGLLGAAFRNGPTVEVFITIPTLDSLGASSGADVDINEMSGENLRARASSGANINLNNITFEKVSMSASSGADVDASGTCISVSGSVSSGADIDAGGLECKDANAEASSGGDLTLNASVSLDANASSGGSVSIVGNPKDVDINTSSGGDVRLKD